MPETVTEEEKVSELFRDSDWYDKIESWFNDDEDLNRGLNYFLSDITAFVQRNSIFDYNNSREIAVTLITDVADELDG